MSTDVTLWPLEREHVAAIWLYDAPIHIKVCCFYSTHVEKNISIGLGMVLTLVQ